MWAFGVYAALSAAVGYLGRRRTIGFSGCFVAALVLSPLVTAAILLVTQPKDAV